MSGVMSLFVFLGTGFLIILVGLLIFIFVKLALGHVESSKAEKEEKANYMADAPAEPHGPHRPG